MEGDDELGAHQGRVADVADLAAEHIKSVAAALLGVGGEASSAALRTGQGAEAVRAFVGDGGGPILLLVSHPSGGSSGYRLEVRGGAGIEWRGGGDDAEGEGSQAVVLVRGSAPLKPQQSLSQQLQVISLGGSLVDSLHTYVHRSFAPLLEGYFAKGSSSGVAAGGGRPTEAPAARDRGGNASAASLVRKKVAELELALRGCQEAVRIPEVSLREHLVKDIVGLAQDIRGQPDNEGRERAKEDLMARLKCSEEMKNATCNSVLSWHRELSDLSVRFDKQLESEDTSPLHERDFWVRMERALAGVEQQTRLPEVELTLEMVKRLKIRGHIPRQFEEDAEALRTKLESAQKYCILLKDFPVADVQAAPDIPSLGASVVQVFEHMRRHLVRSRYPVARAAKLLEAVSAEFRAKLQQILRGKKPLDMRFEEFNLLFGYSSRAKGSPEAKPHIAGAAAGGADVSSWPDAGGFETCMQVFEAWEVKEREFMAETSRLRKYHSESSSDSDRLNAVHRELCDRVQQLVRFRSEHESLRSVIVRVTRGAKSGSLQQNALQELHQGYELVREADVLDVSVEKDAWNQAMAEYREMSDRVEAQMAAHLRDSLGSAKNSNDMFQIFSVFSALLIRPKIHAAIQEYQDKLISQVKDDVRALQERFRSKYTNSDAARITDVRSIPPIAGSVIWARQVERRLQMYVQRMQDVLGAGWEQHAEGLELKRECEAFGSRLDASVRLRKWQDDVLQQHSQHLDGFNAESFLLQIFVVRKHGNELRLEVNFDGHQESLVREVHSLTLLSGFKLSPYIDAYASQLKCVYPYAMSIAEALRTYSIAASRVSPAVGLLVEGPRKRMQRYVQLGVDQRALAWTREQQRDLVRDLQQDFGRGSHFLEDFLRKKELSHLEVYTSKLHASAVAFEQKVETALARHATVESVLEALVNCPLERDHLEELLGKVQALVSELELASFSNLGAWLSKIDDRLEAILLARLQQLLEMWTQCLTNESEEAFRDESSLVDDLDGSHVKNQDVRPTEYVRNLSRLVRTRHEIKIRNGALFVDPPIEFARARCLEHLGAAMATVASLPRLQSSAYSELREMTRPEASRRSATFEILVDRLPLEALRLAYDAIAQNVAECEAYVSSWLNYQALWDLDSSEAISRLGVDIGQWIEVLGQLRQSRGLFDTVETQKCFGPITIDFAKVQHGVSVKYDAWNRELMASFASLLAEAAKAVLAKLQAAREQFEQHSLDRGTSDVVSFLTLVQETAKNKEEWGARIHALADGEKMLLRNRFRLPADWLQIDNVEGEWMAFQQIASKKEASLKDEIPTLQSRVLSEDTAVDEKVKLLLSQWASNKPVSGKLQPAAALDALSAFEGRLAELQEQSRLVQHAKTALGMENVWGDRLVSLSSELCDLKEVWQALVKPSGDLQLCADTAWNAVIPRKVRAALDDIMESLFAMSNTMRQYKCCEYMEEMVKGHIKSIGVVTELRSQSMKPRHWESLSSKLGIRWNLTDLTLGNVWSSGIQTNEHIFRDVIALAQGEMGLEEFLKLVREHWTSASLELVSYKQKVSLIRGWEELFSKLGEHSGSLASMRNSPYYRPFEGEASAWEDKLNRAREVFDQWAEIQQRWVYLEGIFLGNADIKIQLPSEYARFKTVDKDFVDLMRGVTKKPLVLDVLAVQDLTQTLARVDDMLCKVQKSLSEYLEQKRSSFPRFYFVGDDDLLEIIGCGKDLAAVQRHLRKMFAGIHQVHVRASGGELVGMVSPQGETVEFVKPITTEGEEEANVWLFEVQSSMQASLAGSLSRGIQELDPICADVLASGSSLMSWMESQCAQAVLLCLQISLCDQVEAELGQGHTVEKTGILCGGLLRLLADSVLHEMSAILRRKAEHLVGELVHQQGVIEGLIKGAVCGSDDFSWLFYMRFYGGSDGVRVSVANADFRYGFEYQGVADRIVQTPLTDRAYLTLTQALHARMGGSPFGPAGTGKTETVKALAGQLGRLVLVFNCDESFDLHAMGRIFLGLCQTGAWGCFDEFNRLEERILSAVSQQILTIQSAVRRGSADVELIERNLPLNPDIGIFVTMNPGYAGRSNLPDNLKQLFRSVAMSKPDSLLIAEIMLYSQGFRQARAHAAKIVPLFRLCADQLSPCAHYDFGLRALKSVLVGAGAIKRKAGIAESTACSEDSEKIVILRSFCGSVIPKLLPQDIPMLHSLLSDVFPKSVLPLIQDDELQREIFCVCNEGNFSAHEGFVNKIMQLSEMVKLHHGIMLVGPSGSGKSAAWHILFEALRRVELKGESSLSVCAPHFYILDPKALSKSELFGRLDPTTREWTDGVLTSILRRILSGQKGHEGVSEGRHWIVLDGDVDPEWVENLNSVLDDNKLLTLPNGERLSLPSNVQILFEVQDLRYATPATVSRCGMVWFGSDNVRCDMVVQRSLSCLESGTDPSWWDTGAPQPKLVVDLSLQTICSSAVKPLLGQQGLVERAFGFAGRCEHVMDFSEQQAVLTYVSLLSGAVADVSNYNADNSEPCSTTVIERFMARRAILSLVWALGGSMNANGRKELSAWMTKEAPDSIPNYEGNGWFHYDVRIKDGEWSSLEDRVPVVDVETSRVADGDVLVATAETVQHEDMVRSLLRQGRHTLLCGPPGSGKTMTVSACVQQMPEAQLVALNFSSTTSPSLLLKTLEHYCETVRTPSGVTMRPQHCGRVLVILCDEINLPSKDAYGTQHVISLLRQLVEHRGFWRSKDLSWVRLERVLVVGACNPPSDEGRVDMSPRFLRQVALLHIDFPAKPSLRVVYGTLCRALLRTTPGLRTQAQPLADCMVHYYCECSARFSRDVHAHYIFSPRELSRWTRALHEALRRRDGVTLELLVQLVVHEGLRIFQDRLVSAAEKQWADDAMDSAARSFFGSADLEKSLQRPILFSSWLSRDYERVERESLRDFVKARMRIFYEEELSVPLVVFDQMLDHVVRIDRVLKQPLGHALLVGASGAGKTVMTRFVAWLNGLSIFQIKAHRGYSQADFEGDLRKVMKRAGCEGESVCFIFDESNALSAGFLELMNALLASGEVPGLFEGDDWVSLMHKCREAATRDGLMLDTEEELFRRFTEQVRTKLHVVFTMNPASPDFKSRNASSPALFNRCVVDWVGDWEHDTLDQVASEFTTTLDLGIAPGADFDADNTRTRRSLVSALIYSQSVAEQACVRASKIREHSMFVTPRHFVDMVNQFVSIFCEKKAASEDQQMRLSVGLRKLTQTSSDVQNLARSLSQQEQQLHAKEALANEKLQSMVGDQRAAEKSREGTQALQDEVEGQQRELRQRRAKVEEELAEAGPAVEEARKSVQGIKRQQLDEVRSMMNPPNGVKVTMEAICAMLYDLKKPSWEDIRKTIRKDDFIPSIIGFSTQDYKASPSRMKTIQSFVEDPDFTFDVINKSSKACGPLVQWIRAQHLYATVLDSVAPLRAEMQVLEEAAAKGSKRLAALEETASALESKIGRLKEEYAVLISDVQGIKSEMVRVQARVSRSSHLLGSLAGERARWERQAEAFGAQVGTLVGNAGLASAFLAFMGMFDQDVRLGLKTTLLSFMQKQGLSVLSDLDFTEYLASPDDRVMWQVHGLPDDELCMENAVMLARCNRYPLIVDPSGQGTHFLQAMFSEQRLVNTSLVDASFIKHLESAMRFGTPLLVADVESIDQILNPVLNREVSKIGGRTVIRVGGQDIDVSPAFRLYLSTRDASCRFSADLCSRVTLVNFTVTPSGLRRQTLAAALRSERPDVDRKRIDLVRLQGEYVARLTQCEKSLLQALAESEGNVLEDDSLIETLERIKAEGREVEEKVSSQETLRESVAAVTKLFEPLATACSSIYFALQAMGEIHALYQFSVRWFMDVFGRVLKIEGVDDESSQEKATERPSHLVDLVFRETFRQASVSVLEVHKMGLALRFVQMRLASKGTPIDSNELGFLFETATGVPPTEQLNSDLSLSNKQNSRLKALSTLPAFSPLSSHMHSNNDEWSRFLADSIAEKCVPLVWGSELPPETAAWRALLVLYALRPDRLAAGARLLVSCVLGDSAIAGEESSLSGIIKEAPAWLTTVVLCSAAGFDAGARVDALAAARNVPYKNLAMGSADGVAAADKALTWAAEHGGWVLLKNVHLARSWLPQLEKRLHRVEKHAGFRLFVTIEQNAADAVPQSLLLNSRIVIVEPAAGLKASMLRSLETIPLTRMSRGPSPRARLHMLLAWFHGVVMGRLSYSPQGWTKRYEFSETDLSSALDTLDSALDAAARGLPDLEPGQIPWTTLRELICTACYGGRIDNDFDFRALTSLMERLVTPESFGPTYSLTPLLEGNRDNVCLPVSGGANALRHWASALSGEEVPAWLGLSSDADVVLHSQQGQNMLSNWLALQVSHLVEDEAGPQDKVLQEPVWSSELLQNVDTWLAAINNHHLVENFRSPTAHQMAPVVRCLERELEQGSRIVADVRRELENVKFCVEGKMHKTNAVRDLISRLRKSEVPPAWLSHHGVTSTLKVGEWIADLVLRLEHLSSLVQQVASAAGDAESRCLEVWLGGLFQPGAFLTASRQWAARCLEQPLEALTLCCSLGQPAAMHHAKASFTMLGSKMFGTDWDVQSCRLVHGDSTGRILKSVVCYWAPAQDCGQEAFLDMPLYLTEERRELLATIHLPAHSAEMRLVRSYYEIGAAITLWGVDH